MENPCVISYTRLPDESYISLNLFRFVSLESERYSGTTAVVCLISDNLHLHTASVGDSRAVLCRRGNALPLTEDHCPAREDERDRIEQEGGIIVSNSIGTPLVSVNILLLIFISAFHM